MISSQIICHTTLFCSYVYTLLRSIIIPRPIFIFAEKSYKNATFLRVISIHIICIIQVLDNSQYSTTFFISSVATFCTVLSLKIELNLIPMYLESEIDSLHLIKILIYYNFHFVEGEFLDLRQLSHVS